MNDSEDILEFGIKRENEERRDGGCGVIFDPVTQMFAVGRDYEDGFLRLLGGGFNDGEDEKEGTIREIVEESGLHDFLHIEKIAKVLSHYHNRAKNVDRMTVATCFLVVLRSKKQITVKLEEHEKFTLDWAPMDKIISGFHKRNQNKDYDHWIHFLTKAEKRLKELKYLK
jgi:ADP-ribose pyrophosphatase YjhB (NUDIX family)